MRPWPRRLLFSSSVFLCWEVASVGSAVLTLDVFGVPCPGQTRRLVSMHFGQICVAEALHVWEVLSLGFGEFPLPFGLSEVAQFEELAVTCCEGCALHSLPCVELLSVSRRLPRCVLHGIAVFCLRCSVDPSSRSWRTSPLTTTSGWKVRVCGMCSPHAWVRLLRGSRSLDVLGASSLLTLSSSCQFALLAPMKRGVRRFFGIGGVHWCSVEDVWWCWNCCSASCSRSREFSLPVELALSNPGDDQCWHDS